MQYFTVTRCEFDGLDPDIFIKIQRYRNVAIVDKPRCRNRLRRNVIDQVWLAKREQRITEAEFG